MPQTIMAATCCCEPEQMYIAYPCWSKAGRTFFMNAGNPGATQSFIASGSNPASSTPPVGTLSKVVLIGAGGAGNGTDSGGGGAYVESEVTFPSTAMTVRVGKGGPVNGTSGGAPFGGASGASNTRWGGGASAFRLNATTDFIAGGGGAAGSSGFTAQTSQPARGGDAGISASSRPAQDITVAGGSTSTNGGAGGVSGGGSGSVGALPSPGSGGTGASGAGTGGGGGGGGRAAGGGGGSRTVGATTYGGAGTGGSSRTDDIFLAHGGFKGYAQASSYTSKSLLRGSGDGGTGAGFDGRVVFEWRGCTSCPCPEMPSGIPPVLHLCLTQSQLGTLLAAAGNNPCATNPPDPLNPQFIAFNYKGWPFFINPFDSLVEPPRPCSQTGASSDLSGGFWTSFSNYCCRVWRLDKADLNSGLCTPKCTAGGCPTAIYMCDKYRRDIGLPSCPNAYGPDNCIYVQYGGCEYLFGTTSYDASCAPAGQYSPLNVGSGVIVKSCTPDPETGLWQVGPTMYTGGLQLGDSCTLSWNVSSIPWPVAAVQACVPNLGQGGPWQHTYTMNCLPTPDSGVSPPFCNGNKPVCGCGSSNPPCSNEPGRKYLGQCNTCGGSPCVANCPACFERLVESQLLLLSGSPDDPPTYEAALTVTRNCPHPTGSSWLSVGPGSVQIDGCTFSGNGTLADFAARINQVLGDRLTAVGSPCYWLGPRWRGSMPYPDDNLCCGYSAPDDSGGAFASGNATTQVAYLTYGSWWTARAYWTSIPGSADTPTAGCCCDGAGQGAAGCRAITSAYNGPSQPETACAALSLASLGPLTWDGLVYDPVTQPDGSVITCSSGGGVTPWSPPTTVTVS